MAKKERIFDLEERLIDFAVRIIHAAESLQKTKVGKHVAAQLVRSGTSPAANYGEAQSAESRSDFIHKMKICLNQHGWTNRPAATPGDEKYRFRIYEHLGVVFS